MSDVTDNVRSGLAALAEEVRPVDLRDRALRTSRRLAVRRTVLTAVVAGVAVGLLTTTVALALPSEQVTPPVPPAESPEPSTVVEPTPPTRTESPTVPETGPPILPDDSSSATPTESQAPPDDPEIPAAAMLQAEDLGQGYQTDDDTPQHHGSLSMLMAYCGQTIVEESLQGRNRAFSSGDGVYVDQEEVDRYGADGAARVMDRIRNALPDCQQVQVQGDPKYVSELTVLQEDFAGDESLLIRDVYTTPETTITRYHAVVRQGDLYAQVLLEVESQDRALEIANAAADRLCEATTSC